MKYKNTKTGSTIDIDSELSGENWEKVKTSPKSPEKKAGDKNETVRKSK